MTTYNEAVKQLKTVTSVGEWNYIRDGLKQRMTMKDIVRLDQSGLIVEVLGPDKVRQPNPEQEQW